MVAAKNLICLFKPLLQAANLNLLCAHAPTSWLLAAAMALFTASRLHAVTSASTSSSSAASISGAALCMGQ